MLRLWQATRDGRGRVTLWKGLAAYILALLLPDFLFNQLIARLHRRHRADSPNPTYSGPAAQPELAP